MSLPDRVSDLMPFELLLSVSRTGSLGLAAAEHGIWADGRQLTGPAADLRAIAVRAG
jgi:hypothetical protein